MTDPCKAPLPFDDLAAYRRGELEPGREREVEEHYFGCASCAERLAWLESLELSVVLALRRGLFDVIVSKATVERLERSGGVLRRYDVGVGESVNCTSAPGETMTIVTLRPPLRPNVPLTLVLDILDHASGQHMQQARGVFQDQQTGEVTIALASEMQQRLGKMRLTLSIRYGEGHDVETAGPFEMNHAPYGA